MAVMLAEKTAFVQFPAGAGRGDWRGYTSLSLFPPLACLK